MHAAIDAIKSGLVVSCQAAEGNPLRGPHYMAAMAKAASIGGAVGIRAEGTEGSTRVGGSSNTASPFIAPIATTSS